MSQSLNPVPKEKLFEYYKKTSHLRQEDGANKITALLNPIEPSFQLGMHFTIIMDYVDLSYHYIRGNTQKILGYNPEEVVNGGMMFIYNLIHPVDQEKLAASAIHYQDFIHNLPLEERMKWKTNINFRIRNAEGKYIRMLEQLMVVGLNDEGYMRYTCKHFTDISHLPYTDEINLTLINDTDPENFLIQVINIEPLKPALKQDFSSRELEILDLIGTGMGSKEIADKLSISYFTVKNHRKNMMDKIGAKNMPEVLNYAYYHNLIKKAD